MSQNSSGKELNSFLQLAKVTKQIINLIEIKKKKKTFKGAELQT